MIFLSFFSKTHIFQKKKTREEYAQRKFRKDHDYNKSDKTISVNGERYKFDDNYKSKTMTVKKDGYGNEGEVPRQTAAENQNSDPTIHVDKNFYRLKNSKRREGVLQHEVGHTKLHNSIGDAKHVSKDLKNREGGQLYLSTIVRQTRESLMNSIFSKEDIDEYLKSSEFKAALKDLREKYNAGGMSENQVRSTLRKTAMQKLRKYQNKNNSHANVQEFEADRYAANKVGTKNIKKGVRETYTRTKRDTKRTIDKLNIDKDTKKTAMSQINKNSQDDMKRRSRALKDKSLTQKEKENYK